jgi:tetratricopeptide (TPR) repeat protein
LKVKPRTDVAVFKNKIVPMRKIAEDLKVNYIVEGSVRISGDDLRVNVQLFDIAQDNMVWSDSYNNKLKDIFNVQDEIASKIVAKLAEKLTIAKTDLKATKRKSTENLEAYKLVMEAYEHINNPIYTETKLGELINPIAEKAIKLDSTYADAYAISSLAKMFKWMNVNTDNNEEFRKQEIKDHNEANLHAKIALKYDQDNHLALAVKIFLPLFTSNEEFEVTKILIIRGMMIDVQMLLKKYPDNIFSQYIYAVVLSIKTKIQGGETEGYQEPLNRVLEIYKIFKKNDFVLSHPTEGLALRGIFELIPNLYYLTGEGEKGLEFLKDNKHNFCAKGTYDCLNPQILTQIGNGFYESLDYENSLEIINLILSQSEEELLAIGNTIADKIEPYYRSGMIYMKWRQYEKAIEGFTQALNLSLENKSDNQWWNAHYYRRLGLVYYFKGDYVNALNNYSHAFRLNEVVDDNEKYSIKSLCSYGYMEELLGNHDLAKEKMMECSSWVLENREKIEDDHDTYESIWFLHLYHKNLNQQDKASKYLNLAYKSVGIKRIEKYHKHSEKDTHPAFFYCRDIIKAYESSLNQ